MVALFCHSSLTLRVSKAFTIHSRTRGTLTRVLPHYNPYNSQQHQLQHQQPQCTSPHMTPIRPYSSSTALNMARKINNTLYYRADRVLASRTDMSRSQCAEYFKQKRISILLDELTATEEEEDEKEKDDEDDSNSDSDDDEVINEEDDACNNSDSSDSDSSDEEDENEKEDSSYDSDSDSDSSDDEDSNNDNNANKENKLQLRRHGTALVVASVNETSVVTYKRPRNFQIIPGPSVKILMDSPLYIDRTHAVPLPPPLLVAYHKPKWVLSVRRDPHNRPCLSTDLLGDMHPVGRLDYDSSGLLLFSSSGPLTQHLLHPKHAVPKEYVATVTGHVDADLLRQQLTEGVTTSEGVHTAELVNVEYMEKARVEPYLNNIHNNLPPEYDLIDLQERGYLKILEATELSTVRLIVQEGKYRMVRRMLANCGHPVVSLKREKLGAVSLKDLEPGQWRRLDAEELQWAQEITPAPKAKKAYRAKKSTDKNLQHTVDKEKALKRRMVRLQSKHKREHDLEFVRRKMDQDEHRKREKQKRTEAWARAKERGTVPDFAKKRTNKPHKKKRKPKKRSRSRPRRM